MECWVNLESATWTRQNWTHVVRRSLTAVLPFNHWAMGDDAFLSLSTRETFSPETLWQGFISPSRWPIYPRWPLDFFSDGSKGEGGTSSHSMYRSQLHWQLNLTWMLIGGSGPLLHMVTAGEFSGYRTSTYGAVKLDFPREKRGQELTKNSWSIQSPWTKFRISTSSYKQGSGLGTLPFNLGPSFLLRLLLVSALKTLQSDEISSRVA